MPTLPTLTVTQAQADLLISVFGTSDNYLAWLKETLIYTIKQKQAGTTTDLPTA